MRLDETGSSRCSIHARTKRTHHITPTRSTHTHTHTHAAHAVHTAHTSCPAHSTRPARSRPQTAIRLIPGQSSCHPPPPPPHPPRRRRQQPRGRTPSLETARRTHPHLGIRCWGSFKPLLLLVCHLVMPLQSMLLPLLPQHWPVKLDGDGGRAADASAGQHGCPRPPTPPRAPRRAGSPFLCAPGAPGQYRSRFNSYPTHSPMP